jgi:hypothetical protein
VPGRHAEAAPQLVKKQLLPLKHLLNRQKKKKNK